MTQFLIDQETHENCVPREQHRAEVAAAEERGAAKERERAAKGAAGLRGSHPTMKRGILCLQLATPDDAMESIRRALPDLIAAYAELTVPPLLFDEEHAPWREPPDGAS